MTKAEKAEVINFVSAWLDHKVAAIEEGIKQLQRQQAELRRRVDALPVQKGLFR
jgi:hypothetical protein